MGLTPKTTLGWWSVGLMISCPVLFLIGATLASYLYASVPAGDTILDDLTSRPALAVSALVAMGCGISAGVVGLVAIVRRKERALLVILATAASALLLLFLVGEVVSPQ
jgi:hypothetical protein